MNRIIIIFLLLNFSCKANKTVIDSSYKLTKKEAIFGYNLLTYNKKNDTILVVVPNEIYQSCRKSNFKFLNDTTYRKVSGVGKESINTKFYYKVKTSNGIEIDAGDFAPGDTENLVYSYKGFPYLLDDCQPFKPNDQ